MLILVYMHTVVCEVLYVKLQDFAVSFVSLVSFKGKHLRGLKRGGLHHGSKARSGRSHGDVWKPQFLGVPTSGRTFAFGLNAAA